MGERLNSTTVIKGKAGEGKTTNALQHTALELQEGNNVLYVTTEETKSALISRLVEVLAPTIQDKMSAGFGLTDEEAEQFSKAKQLVNSDKFTVDSRRNLSSKQITNNIVKVNNKQCLNVVVIDCVGTVRGLGNSDEDVISIQEDVFNLGIKDLELVLTVQEPQ